MSQQIPSSKEELASLMTQIDALDSELAKLLGQRFQRSRRIGDIKKCLAMPSSDPGRIAQQIDHFTGQAVGHGVEGQLAEALIKAIIDRVVAERRISPQCDGRVES